MKNNNLLLIFFSFGKRSIFNKNLELNPSLPAGRLGHSLFPAPPSPPHESLLRPPPPYQLADLHTGR
ncbi:hypothetical protein L6452_21520 [Arctium lappa]|uniref:Uncharacterized protein n=1 Tax=Arctium lappa TaxID=4217 RepID=A0ACB9AY29_ARCLA|nr:hypothetical protein L6452_21520 [Arctium lappa]